MASRTLILTLLLALPSLGCGDKDGDDDGIVDGEDCDDGDASVGKAPTWHPDVDGDGYGSDRADLAVEACTAPAGYLADDSDCDDTDASSSPEGSEVCDGADNDCDGLFDDDDDSLDEDTRSPFYRDADGDGYGEDIAVKYACEAPDGYVELGGDCDDTDKDLNPEIQWYQDADDDGYGDPYAALGSCEQPDGYVSDASDCNDSAASINPDGQEVCDSLDNDCDGLVDDEDDSLDGTTGTPWYPDSDGDGYGDAHADATWACDQPEDLIDDASDCDDSTSLASPEGTEVCDDGLDNDCDGTPNHCGLSGDIDAADADVVFAGSDGQDYVGYAVASAGDVDGDGYDDLLLGAWGYDTDASRAGFAAIAYGSPTWSGTTEVDDLPGWVGTDQDEYAGRAVAGVGDVDGDGYDDLMIGAYGKDGSSNTDGVAWLLYGGARTTGQTLADDAADARFLGASLNESAGYGVYGGDDLDGDGFSEFMVGAKYAGAKSGGVVYLFYGSATAWSGDFLSTDAQASFEASSQYDAVGEKNSSDTVPDADGDGVGEVLIGAYGDDPGANGAGSVFLYLGPLSGDYGYSDADWTMEGNSESGGLGFAVVGLQDFNLDGYGDIAAGAYLNDDGEGAVMVHFGSVSGWTGTINDTDADVVINGEQYQEYLGRSLGSGDVDGNGTEDLIAGSYGYTQVDDIDGRVSVFYAQPDWSGTYDLSDAAHAIVNTTKDAGYFGYSVTGQGDFDGDGAGELVIGAYRADTDLGVAQGGEVRLFWGGGY